MPTGIKFFSWVGTLWEGKLSFETPMLFVLGAISIFLLGGLSGPPNGVVATDLHLQDTYWIVGHFHATLFGGFVFPFFAAIYYWFPKMTGRMYNERLGKLHFWLMLPAFYVQSLGQMETGLLGMRRRIADYRPRTGDPDSAVARHHRWLCHRHIRAHCSHQLLPQRPEGRGCGSQSLALALVGMADRLARSCA